MNDTMTLAEVERRLKSGQWYYDPELRCWIDKRDGRLVVALEALHDLTRRLKAADEAKWLAEVEAVTAEAQAAGDSPVGYALKLRDERKAEYRRDQAWWAAHPPTLPPEMQRKTAPLTVTESKAATNGEATFSGYLAVFGNEDLAGDILSQSACDDSLRALKAAPYSARYLLPLLYQHKMDMPLGGFSEIQATSRGLAVTGHINTDTALGRDTASMIRSGALAGLSIGFVPERSFVNRKGQRVLQQIKLLEGSVVTLPANPLARIYSELA